jgi:hypothetical protein
MFLVASREGEATLRLPHGEAGVPEEDGAPWGNKSTSV